MGDFRNKRVIGVRVCEHGADREEDCQGHVSMRNPVKCLVALVDKVTNLLRS